MPAFGIVEALDVVEYISSHLVSGPVRFAHHAANNMPTLQAIKTLEELQDVAAGRLGGATQRAPGLQIVINPLPRVAGD